MSTLASTLLNALLDFPGARCLLNDHLQLLPGDPVRFRLAPAKRSAMSRRNAAAKGAEPGKWI